MRAFQISSYHASLASFLNCTNKTCKTSIKRTWEGVIISCDVKAPLLIFPHIKSCVYHLALSSCIILRIAPSCIDLCHHLLVCAIWFFASRARVRAVRAEVRLHPWGGYRWFLYRWSDRRAHLLHLFYSFILVVLLLSLCCDSVVSRVLFHLLPYICHVTPPLPTTCCLLLVEPCES